MNKNALPAVEPPAKSAVKEPPPKPAAALRRSAPIRSPVLFLLAVIAVVFMLDWAQAFFIPLMLSVMISYALSPIVNRLERWHVPRALGAGVLLLTIVGALAVGAYSLYDEANSFIDTLPELSQKLGRTLRHETAASAKAVEKVQKAASHFEQTTSSAKGEARPPKGVTRVQVEEPRLDVTDYLWQGTVGAAKVAGQGAMVLFLAYFLLASGNLFRRKLVKISGSTLERKKVTVQVLDEITDQIQRYLLVLVFTSLIVGVLTWITFIAIGMEHAAIWGVAAGVFNAIPYLGPVIVLGATSVAAFFQFGTLSMALLVGGVSLIVTSIEGFLLTPWLAGRASRMNAAVVFVGVLFWGWLWGAWGLLLGVPIIMIVKSVCDHVEDLKPIGELLGD